MIEVETQVDESEMDRCLDALAPWKNSEGVSGRDRDVIRRQIDSLRLTYVPIAGAAAIFRMQIVTIRGYLKLGLIEPADFYRGMHIFRVPELRVRYAEIRRLKTSKRKLREVAALLNKNQQNA